MAQFENYLERKKQEDPMTLRREQEQRGLQEQRFEVGMDYLELVDYYEERMEKTTFQERTRYYFENAGLMASKSKRYRTISEGGLNVEAFARSHRNHSSAYKRKNSAAKAAKSFGKAAVLADKYSKKQCNNAYDLYTRREEIMRLRMEGMLSAAETKSTSEENEAYLKAKAKVSCLMVLKDQIKNLKKQAELLKDQRSVQKLKKKETSIQKELREAREYMAEYVITSNMRWQNANGIREHRYDNAVMEGRELETRGIKVTLEGAKTQMNYEVIHKQVKDQHMEFPCQVAKTDRNGQPISLADAKKLEWNQRYREAVEDGDQKTVNRMTSEALERIKKMYVPSIAYVEEQGLTTLFRQNPADYYEMLVTIPEYLEKQQEEGGAVYEAVEKDPVLQKKARLLWKLNTLFKLELRDEQINYRTGDFARLTRPKEIEIINALSEAAAMENAMEREEEKIAKEKAKDEPDVMTLEERKAEYDGLKQINRNFSKDDYKVYRAFRYSAMVYKDERYQQISRGMNVELSRTFGAFLRAVHLDKKGRPITEEDRIKKEQNDRWMNSWVVPENETEEEKQRREAVQKEIVDKEISTIYDGFTFPEPEDLLDWLKEMVKTKPFALNEMLKRSIAIDKMAEIYPPLEEYKESHPEFGRNQRIATALSLSMPLFMRATYGIDTENTQGIKVETTAGQAMSKGMFEDPEEYVGYRLNMFVAYRRAYYLGQE